MNIIPFLLVTLLNLASVNEVWASSYGPELPGLLSEARAPFPLSLHDAIKISLEHNYDLLVAHERIQEAQGSATARLGSLLPNLSAKTDARHLKTFQGEFGGQDAVSTPRDIYDFRGQLTQSIFSMGLIRQWQARRTNVTVVELESKIAVRDTIATTALLYFDAVRANEVVKARQKSVQLSQKIWKITEGRKAAGAATGIDVMRANVQYQRERRDLLSGISERDRTKLDLLRAMGVSEYQDARLTDRLELIDIKAQSAEEAIKSALDHRTEVKAQTFRLKLAKITRSSIEGERIPSLDFRGDYGLIGESFDDRFATYNVGLFLSIPLFDGGQRIGRIQESQSQLRQEALRAQQLVHQISIEVRNALMNANTIREQFLVSQEMLRLALKELELSQKAFSIGTVSHIELINAQSSVSEAQNKAIDALFRFTAARINLARAQGQIHTIYSLPSLYTQK